MSKWRKWEEEDHSDHFEKTQKIRRKKSVPKFSDRSSDFEVDEKNWPNKSDEDFFAARVVEVHKRYAFVSKEDKRGSIDTRDVWLATIARKFLTEQRGQRNFVVVGDRVLCKVAREGEVADASIDLPQCSIQLRTPRVSQISRVDPTHKYREHLLASNAEQMIVVASLLSPKIRWGLVDRCLVMAEVNHMRGILVFNKKDLLEACDDEEFRTEVDARIKDYRNMGYTVFVLSLNQTDKVLKSALKEIQNLFNQKISMVIGHSGVGKSTLVNHFKPEIEQYVEPDGDIFYKGRHTTSFASLIKLGTGGYLIDTPGVRSFSLGSMDSISLTSAFRDFKRYLGRCKYRECTHKEEPGCAVKEAVSLGEVSSWRYHSFRGILDQDTGREGKASYVDCVIDEIE